MHPLTIWLVCDPDSPRDREFIYNAINFYVYNNFSILLFSGEFGKFDLVFLNFIKREKLSILFCEI